MTRKNRWILALCACFVGSFVAVGAITGPPPAPVRTAAPEPARGGPDRPELALFRHYLQDIRWMLTGATYPACSGRLAQDVGCSLVSQAQTALVQRRFPEAVALLTKPLRLNGAEEEAWLRMLPIVYEDEQRPTWQKAGVRR